MLTPTYCTYVCVEKRERKEKPPCQSITTSNNSSRAVDTKAIRYQILKWYQY